MHSRTKHIAVNNCAHICVYIRRIWAATYRFINNTNIYVRSCAHVYVFVSYGGVQRMRCTYSGIQQQPATISPQLHVSSEPELLSVSLHHHHHQWFLCSTKLSAAKQVLMHWKRFVKVDRYNIKVVVEGMCGCFVIVMLTHILAR